MIDSVIFENSPDQLSFSELCLFVIMATGLAYSQSFLNSILLTNESSPVGSNGLLQYENDNLEISIESPLNWNIVEETNSTSFSPCTIASLDHT